MLQLVDVGRQSLDAYAQVVGQPVIEELQALGKDLRGARVAHINATSYGGGVSELLRSLVPLMRDLGIAADWKVIHGDEPFFTVTKAFHNALQGAEYGLPTADRETYLAHNALNAELLEEDYDYIVVHDPQPAAIRHFHGRDGAKWVWRCHIDTSYPNPTVIEFLRPLLAEYDAAVFTLAEFAPPEFPIERVTIIPPAIDPLSPKNLPLPMDLAHSMLDWIGVDLDKPLVTQVSRFDPWKDPLGVIKAYRLVREYVPDLQLALVGSMALDDPEGWEVYRQISEARDADPLIHVFTNLTGVGNTEVNAFQRCSRVVLQKSIREGFGLVVSEALWKTTPVVAGKTGGLPLQMPPGIGGFLVASVEEAADKMLWLLQHPEAAVDLAHKGRQRVEEQFLLPRLLADELKLLRSL